jgi:hypothetical protein
MPEKFVAKNFWRAISMCIKIQNGEYQPQSLKLTKKNPVPESPAYVDQIY